MQPSQLSSQFPVAVAALASGGGAGITAGDVREFTRLRLTFVLVDIDDNELASWMLLTPFALDVRYPTFVMAHIKSNVTAPHGCLVRRLHV